MLCFINKNWYFWENLTVFCLFHFNIISSFENDKWIFGAALRISICLTALKYQKHYYNELGKALSKMYSEHHMMHYKGCAADKLKFRRSHAITNAEYVMRVKVSEKLLDHTLNSRVL